MSSLNDRNAPPPYSIRSSSSRARALSVTNAVISGSPLISNCQRSSAFSTRTGRVTRGRNTFLRVSSPSGPTTVAVPASHNHPMRTELFQLRTCCTAANRSPNTRSSPKVGSSGA